MSSLKDKIYNYEVAPPAGAWDKIAIDLNEAALENKFPDRLYGMEAAAPATSWEKIAAALGGSAQDDKYPDRLYNMEVAPPARSWEKINAGLQQVGETVQTSRSRSIPAFLRYAAAAIFIGAIAFGVIKFTLTGSNSIKTEAQIPVKKDTSKSGVEANSQVSATETPAAKNDIEEEAPEPGKGLLAKLDQSSKTLARKLTASRSKTRYADNNDSELIQSIYAYEDHVPNLADRYVMLMTPDGNIIRMSKKWSELLCCVSGEEQDPDCKDQLKKWQQKMATSSLAPSPGNFLDILSLVNSLN